MFECSVEVGGLGGFWVGDVGYFIVGGMDRWFRLDMGILVNVSVDGRY